MCDPAVADNLRFGLLSHGSPLTRALLAMVVCAALAACGGLATRATAPAPPTPATHERLPVYVIKRPWHVEVGIALADAQPPLRPVAAAFPEARYLLFGFGDRRYLLQGGAGNMVAAVWGGAGLVLVTNVGLQQPEQVFGQNNVVRVALTPRQMSDLQGFIARTFAWRDGAIVPVFPGSHAVGSYSAYYESVQRYSALHTCNTWAAEALKSAELPVSSAGVEFAWQLWEQVRRLEDTSPGAGSPEEAASDH
jgi:hypothetical protein